MTVRGLVLAAALLAALAGCGVGAGDGSSGEGSGNDDFGITFRYPSDFEPGTVTSTAESGGGEPVAETALALDEDNALFLAKYGPLKAVVTEQNVDGVLPEVDGLVRQLTGQPAKGRVVELGGLPAVRYDDVGLKEPANGKSRLVFVFDRDIEYLINCQSTPPQRERVDQACDQALSTLAKP